MLEYFKTILSKVSFDRKLFEKELKKAIKALVPIEVLQLRDWCYRNFGHLHPAVLQTYFG